MDKFILFYLFQLYGVQIKGSKKRKKAHSAVLMIVYCKNKFCHKKMFYSKLNLHFETYKERKLFYKVFACYVMNKRNVI